MASTSLSRVARLENWFWTPSPPARDALSGVIFDDPPPRSWPDGTAAKIFNVSELEQRGAAEGKIIMTVSGRRYLLGKAATHASLAAERDAAQREAEALREQLEELEELQSAAALPALTHLGRKKPSLTSGGKSDRQGARPQAAAGTSSAAAGSTRTASCSSSSTILNGNGRQRRSVQQRGRPTRRSPKPHPDPYPNAQTSTHDPPA